MIVGGNKITKDIAQDNAVNLINNNDYVLLSWATGVGKSLAFIKYQEQFNPDGLTYIIVSEINHIQNWKDEYIKHNKENLLKNTKIFCYASLKKYENDKPSLVGLDEAHHALSDLRIQYLTSLSFDKIVALTATLTSEQKQTLNNIFGHTFKEFNITLDNAINNDIIKIPTVYLIPLELNYYQNNTFYEELRGKKEERIVIEDDIKNRFKYLNRDKYKNVHFKFKCSEQKAYCEICANIEYLKTRYYNNQTDYFKNMWLNECSKRKIFLGELKTPYIQKLFNIIKDKRYICSTVSINQANKLGNNSNIIHSKIDEKINSTIISNFNNGIINQIIAVNKLQEGQNLNNIDAAIITQLDSKDRSFIQKTGRALRSENPEIYILYYKNTRDEEFLQNVFDNIKPEYIKTLKL